MVNIEVEVIGTNPIMHHKMRDCDLNKLLGAKGDKIKHEEPSTPKEMAETYAYKTPNGYGLPLEYFRGAFIEASSNYKQKNSSRKSYKPIASAVFRTKDEMVDMFDPDTSKPLIDFDTDIRKATNHQKGAVAVCRPKFYRWTVKFQVEIDDELMPLKIAHDIFVDSGRKVGIGSYRIIKGGCFGSFRVTRFEQI